MTGFGFISIWRRKMHGISFWNFLSFFCIKVDFFFDFFFFKYCISRDIMQSNFFFPHGQVLVFVKVNACLDRTCTIWFKNITLNWRWCMPFKNKFSISEDVVTDSIRSSRQTRLHIFSSARASKSTVDGNHCWKVINGNYFSVFS